MNIFRIIINNGNSLKKILTLIIDIFIFIFIMILPIAQFIQLIQFTDV